MSGTKDLRGRGVEVAAADVRDALPDRDDRAPEPIPADDLEAVRDGLEQARRRQFASRERLRNVVDRLRS